jgi:hypothetical protein
MTRSQRIVVVLYCLLVVYCCVWVPWHVVGPEDNYQLGYGWIWGPANGEGGQGNGGPDITAIALRLLAATALATAAFLLAGKWRSP